MPSFASVTTSGVRWYRGEGGEYLPSVSDCLSVIEKRHYEDWRNRVGHEEADRQNRLAKDRGTRLHKIASDMANSLRRTGRATAENVPAELVPHAEGMANFLTTQVAEVLGVELRLASATLGFGGKMDLYCRMMDGSFAVIDWKSSKNGVTREHGLQTAAYAMLLRDAGFTVNKRLVIWIKPEANSRGILHVREFEDHVDAVKAFSGLVDFWTWANVNKIAKALANHDPFIGDEEDQAS